MIHMISKNNIGNTYCQWRRDLKNTGVNQRMTCIYAHETQYEDDYGLRFPFYFFAFMIASHYGDS